MLRMRPAPVTKATLPSNPVKAYAMCAPLCSEKHHAIMGRHLLATIVYVDDARTAVPSQNG
jgi:hypothetical protein